MLSTAFFLAAVALLLLVNAAGVVLTALQLPGNWLIVLATALFAWAYWGPAEPPDARLIGWYPLVILLGLALLGELLEFLAGALGTRSGGGSKRAALVSIPASIAGALLGSFLIPVPIVGTLVGAALGAAAGAFLGDKWAGRPWSHAFKGATGAAVGRLTGTVLKLIIAAALFLTATLALIF